MKQFFLTLFAVVCTASSSGQSLEECRHLAREHYPEIRQYDLIAQTEQYNLSNAARAWIPQVTLSGQATYQSATPTYPEAFNTILQANGIEMAGISRDQYKIAVDVSQHIWDGGKSKADKAIAEAEAEEQRSRVDVSLYDLQSRIDNLYFGILLLNERKAQTEALIEVLASNLARLQTYYKNGVAMQADVDAVEAELLTARQTLVQVESSRASYRRMLEIFIGQPLAAENLERPAMQQLQSRTSARPELALFEAQEGKLEAQRKAINASLMPRFSAFAQGYYGYPGLDMFKSMVSSAWTPNAIIGVRMSWNIGAFYTKKNNLEKLNAAEKQIAVQRDVFLFNTQMQITQDDGEIARLRQAIADDSRIVELRRRVRMAAESQLENGVIDATDLLRKITDETSASLARSTHEIELLQATYRLKTTLNQ
ncbi:MAG: TolC family protein [Bacteroidaceae bacterium]|nr:TolC family protein [Bacteroidaceae bacterium]